MRRTSGFAVLVLVAVSMNQHGLGQNIPNPEQTRFSAEDLTVQYPIDLPKQALALLSRDTRVCDALDAQGISPAHLPLSWFSATEVHLDGPNEVDLVVVGEGPLRGANVTTFWLFRPTAQGLSLILTTVGHDLDVESARSKGYNNIKVTAATVDRVSTVVYGFDGNKYSVRNRESRPIS